MKHIVFFDTVYTICFYVPVHGSIIMFMLGYNYHIDRQSGTAGGYHPSLTN